MQLNIIVEGNNSIGLGHIYRCIAIADYFQEQSIDVCFFLPYEKHLFILEQYKTRIVPQKIWNNPKNYQKYWLSIFTQKDILLFDLVENKFIEFKFLNNYNFFIASLTLFLFKDKSYFGEISFFPTISKFKKNVFGTEVIASPDFFMVRKEIKAIKNQHRTVISKRPQLLLTMGGSDPCDITTLVIKSLKLVKVDFHCTILIGKLNKNKADIIKYIKNNKKFSYFENVKNIENLYSKTYLAIINGGNTRYELTYLQIPYFCISIHEIQFKISQKVIEKFGGVNLGIYNEISQYFISKQITEYLTNYEKYKQIKKQMKKFRGGNGADIIGNLLINHYNKFQSRIN